MHRMIIKLSPLTIDSVILGRNFVFVPSALEKAQHIHPELLPHHRISGPFRGSRANHGVSRDRLPENPHQKGLRCPNCNVTHTAYEKSVSVSGQGSVEDIWACLARKIANSPNPCSECPVCSSNLEWRQKRSHSCGDMLDRGLPTTLLVPAYIEKAPVPCTYCSHTLEARCECRWDELKDH
jgi:hypothetical protein